MRYFSRINHDTLNSESHEFQGTQISKHIFQSDSSTTSDPAWKIPSDGDRKKSRRCSDISIFPPAKRHAFSGLCNDCTYFLVKTFCHSFPRRRQDICSVIPFVSRFVFARIESSTRKHHRVEKVFREIFLKTIFLPLGNNETLNPCIAYNFFN